MVCTKDKIFEEGYQAFLAGEGPEDNPYDSYLTAPHFELWLEGYWSAGCDDIDEEVV